MVEREANIDLLFRNGLKDLEVLPPAGVWETIEPGILNSGRKLLFLRLAAGIIIVFSIGTTAYFAGRQGNQDPVQSVIAREQEQPDTDDYFVVKAEPEITATEPKPLISEENTFAAQSETINYTDLNDISSLSGLGDFNLNSTTLAVAQVNTGNEEDFIPVLNSRGFKIDPSEWFKLAKEKKNNSDRWMLGALAAPTYYIQYQPDKVNLTTTLQRSEENLLSYSGGLSFSYSVNRKLSIQSGLYYSSISNRVNGVETYSGFRRFANTKSNTNFRITTSNGMIVSTNIDIFVADNTGDRISTAYTIDVFDPLKADLEYITGTIQQSFQYLEIPVILRYKFVDSKIDFNLLGGLSYNLLVGNSAYAMYEGHRLSIGKTEDINPLAFSSSLGLGVGFDLAEKVTLNLEPTLRYYLSKTGNRTDGKNHPYIFGLYSGIFYKF